MIGAINFLMDSHNNGTTIPVDDFRTPRKFGYGEHGQTIGEVSVSGRHEEKKDQVPERTSSSAGIHYDSTEDLGARGRLFGGVDEDRVHAHIGTEGEAGYTYTRDQYAGTKQEHTEIFAGMRGRTFAEVGRLGATVGSEAGVGIGVYGETESRRPGDPDYVAREQWQVDAGLRAAARSHIGVTGAEARMQVEAGIRGRYQYTQVTPLGEDVGGLVRIKGEAFAGSLARADARLGLGGVKTEAEAFAGVRAGVQAGVGLVYKGQELGTVNVKGEGWAGIGARLEAGVEYDQDEKELTVVGEAGAAFGVGGAVGLGVTVGGDDYNKSVFDAVA